MPKLDTVMLKGASGTEYAANVYLSTMRFNDFIPGVYVISKRDGDDETALFIGESDNVDVHIQRNEKKDEIASNGATHVTFHRAANPEKRRAAAADLIEALKPACN